MSIKHQKTGGGVEGGGGFDLSKPKESIAFLKCRRGQLCVAHVRSMYVYVCSTYVYVRPCTPQSVTFITVSYTRRRRGARTVAEP